MMSAGDRDCKTRLWVGLWGKLESPQAILQIITNSNVLGHRYDGSYFRHCEWSQNFGTEQDQARTQSQVC
jgi:hypothetical protein